MGMDGLIVICTVYHTGFEASHTGGGIIVVVALLALQPLSSEQSSQNFALLARNGENTNNAT